jgi:hypothetical protein
MPDSAAGATVERSEDISTVEEAVAYYRAKLSGVRRVTCYEKRVDIVFPANYTHLYTEATGDGPKVSQAVAPGRVDVRYFSVDRARLMDHVLPAISGFVFSIEGQGAKGRENRVLHGPKLASGEHMRVVLRPGPQKAWTCVSAFPVSADAYRQAYGSRRAKFPPK